MANQVLVSLRSIQVLRTMLSGIFLVAGFNHLIHLNKTVNRLNTARLKDVAYFFGDPKWLVIISGVVMLFAGFSLMMGYKTKIAASILLLILIPITITIQIGQMSTLGPLFKNLVIMGGLLFFITNNIQYKHK